LGRKRKVAILVTGEVEVVGVDDVIVTAMKRKRVVRPDARTF
jgi:hypothetical protein